MRSRRTSAASSALLGEQVVAKGGSRQRLPFVVTHEIEHALAHPVDAEPVGQREEDCGRVGYGDSSGARDLDDVERGQLEVERRRSVGQIVAHTGGLVGSRGCFERVAVAAEQHLRDDTRRAPAHRLRTPRPSR